MCLPSYVSRISRIRMRGWVTLSPALRRSVDSMVMLRLPRIRLWIQAPSVSFAPSRTSGAPSMRLRWLALLALVPLTGCGLVYKVDVQQGNLFDKNTVDSLKPGMTKRQVLLVMG